ncbi:hypothetical protein [Oryzomonas rubra]|uniref:Uncharacterized protein n=1 Tax=Oryzomonas rubra TaxID=2509454 RepID=A0A5A9X502_9BACT|nr:hypothetical protein [Oryzomonas rubra]KAA0888070.1 hypothetical protein ET418_16860 [Oryzomonas rubra]
MTDLDSIEWEQDENGNPRPVVMFEITAHTGHGEINAKYLNAILERIRERDFQGKAAVVAANLLGVDVYMLLFQFRDDGKKSFCLYNLSSGRGWLRLTESGFINFLSYVRSLPPSERRSLPVSGECSCHGVIIERDHNRVCTGCGATVPMDMDVELF